MKKLSIILSIILSSCGGGGGGGTDSNEIQNNPPTITNSTFTFSVLENQNLAFVLQASDPDGDSITFQITGGSDQSSLPSIIQDKYYFYLHLTMKIHLMQILITHMK